MGKMDGLQGNQENEEMTFGATQPEQSLQNHNSNILYFMILPTSFGMGRGKSQAEPVTGKSISCKEGLCPSHCKSYKIENGMGLTWWWTRFINRMCTERFQKTSGVKQCSWKKYVNPEAPVQKCS